VSPVDTPVALGVTVSLVKDGLFALKFPEASLATIVEAPLAEAAVVAELGMLVSPEPVLAFATRL
jgi:hypothetical protein